MHVRRPLGEFLGLGGVALALVGRRYRVENVGILLVGLGQMIHRLIEVPFPQRDRARQLVPQTDAADIVRGLGAAHVLPARAPLP